MFQHTRQLRSAQERVCDYTYVSAACYRELLSTCALAVIRCRSKDTFSRQPPVNNGNYYMPAEVKDKDREEDPRCEIRRRDPAPHKYRALLVFLGKKPSELFSFFHIAFPSFPLLV
jgi:hypothetical protein